MTVLLLSIGHIKFLNNPMFSFVLGGWIGFQLFEISLLMVAIPFVFALLMLVKGKFISEEGLKTQTCLSGYFMGSILGVAVQFFI